MTKWLQEFSPLNLCSQMPKETPSPVTSPHFKLISVFQETALGQARKASALSGTGSFMLKALTIKFLFNCKLTIPFSWLLINTTLKD